MKYKKLLKKIAQLTPEQLEQQVVVYDSAEDSFLRVGKHLHLADGGDLTGGALAKDHPFLWL